MFKSSVILPILTASAGLAVFAYAFTRRAGRPSRVRAERLASEDTPAVPEEALERGSPIVGRGSEPAAPDLDLDLAGVFDGGPASEAGLPTVQCSLKVPLPMGGDDAECVGSNEVGQDWLSRATQAERSLSEADLELDLENIPASFDEMTDLEELTDPEELTDLGELTDPDDTDFEVARR